ncbi:MAG: hypothetical protein FWE36_05105 [Erysipelotrichales bacterium]|nr:hypothetical protein [Erysipelotrichales bacterium]
MKFKLHFLKERDRNLDTDGILSFFEKYNIRTERSSHEFTVYFSDLNLENDFSFHITSRSTIENIHQVDPRFLDLNFRFEISPLVPSRKLEMASEVLIKLCRTFDYVLYSPLLKDVFEAKYETIESVYEIFNQLYLKQNPTAIQDFIQADKLRLNSVLKYQSERAELEKFYSHEDLEIPSVNFLASPNNSECFFSIDWFSGNAIIFPPYLDLIYLKHNDHSYYLDFKLIYPSISRFLTVVPGYSTVAYQASGKNLKKVWKLINKEIKAIVPYELVPISNKLIIEK